MGIVLRYSDPNGVEEPSTLVAVASNTRFGTLSFTNNAATGETGVSNVTIEDPGGIYSFAGLRAFDVRESSAPSNNSVIGRFAIQDRQVGRSPEHALITGADREWTLDLVDYNWHLGKRILTDADANRPDETAGDRIRWLLKSAAHFALYDYGYVTYPSDQMEAADYRGQRPLDLLADCAVESGYNFWCDFNEAHGRPELFFMDPGSADYASTLQISNLLSDRDGVITFAPYEDAVLNRSASRIAYGVYLVYEGGRVYVRKDVTGEQFAKVDQSAPMSNVKKKARATRIANHFLNDNDEEDDLISVSIKVPAAQVNDIRHGQLVDVRFQHLPGYADLFTPMRVLRRTVIQEDEGGTGYYRLQLELSASGRTPTTPPISAACSGLGIAITAAGTYEGNHSATTQEPGNLFYFKPGLSTPVVPTVGFAGVWNFPVYVDDAAGDASENQVRILVAGSGTLTVELATYTGGPHVFEGELWYGPLAGDIHETYSGIATGAREYSIPADEHCYHWIELGDDGTATGGKWQFVSWTWAPD